eukprot:550571-Pelagomonas_calceolata.AAC.3
MHHTHYGSPAALHSHAGDAHHPAWKPCAIALTCWWCSALTVSIMPVRTAIASYCCGALTKEALAHCTRMLEVQRTQPDNTRTSNPRCGELSDQLHTCAELALWKPLCTELPTEALLH